MLKAIHRFPISKLRRDCCAKAVWLLLSRKARMSCKNKPKAHIWQYNLVWSDPSNSESRVSVSFSRVSSWELVSFYPLLRNMFNFYPKPLYDIVIWPVNLKRLNPLLSLFNSRPTFHKQVPAFNAKVISQITFQRGDLWICGSKKVYCHTPSALWNNFSNADRDLYAALLHVVLDLKERALPHLDFYICFIHLRTRLAVYFSF